VASHLTHRGNAEILALAGLSDRAWARIIGGGGARRASTIYKIIDNFYYLALSVVSTIRRTGII
jgi:hypothetical protein